jgi:hypothetical protein
MRLDYLAAVLESVYYNGKPKSNKKLEREDFNQIAIASVGTYMRTVYRDEDSYASIFMYFGNCLSPKQFTANKDANHRWTISLDTPVVKLPHGVGVFSVKPIDNKGYIHDNQALTRLEGGADWLYTEDDLDDLGQITFTIKGNTLFIKNLFATEEKPKFEVEGIFIEDSLEVPEDVAFQVMNYVFTKLIPTEGFPIDKTDDGNPNLIEYKKRLQGSDQL